MKLCQVMGGALLLTMLTSAGWADSSSSSSNRVSWKTIIGTFFIPATPPATGSGNTVGGIIGGGEPWSTLGGHADVDLSTGAVNFEVKGLVLAGGNSTAPPGRSPRSRGRWSATRVRLRRRSSVRPPHRWTDRVTRRSRARSGRCPASAAPRLWRFWSRPPLRRRIGSPTARCKYPILDGRRPGARQTDI